MRLFLSVAFSVPSATFLGSSFKSLRAFGRACPKLANISVCISPGQSAVTLIFCALSSSPSPKLNALKYALLALYTSRFTFGAKELTDETSTILLALCIKGRQILVSAVAAVIFSAIISSALAKEMSLKLP